MKNTCRLDVVTCPDPERTRRPSGTPPVEPASRLQSEPCVAIRILAEPSLIDAAFRANPADWSVFKPMVIDILMNRR